MKWIAPFVLCAAPAFAEQCPVVTDHSTRLDQIYTALNAPDGQAAQPSLSQELWEIWTDAPDSKAQELLEDGMRKTAANDYLGARDVLDQLIAYCPDYAEGYNQRAFANFLRRDFEAALDDLNKAIEIMPNHVAALSGKGLTLIGLGRDDEAQQALRAAVALNPWLSERSLLKEPAGQDI